jgi:hypothetical protein
MKMTLHSIPHQKGEYHGLSKPQAQNGDSVEKVDGHRDPSGSDNPLENKACLHNQEYEESVDCFTLGQPCVMDGLADKHVTNLEFF